MARKHARRKGTRRWSANVKTVSTYPPAGLFKKSAPVMARTLASKRVSPRAGFGHAHAELLHQPRGTQPEPFAPRNAQARKRITVGADSPGQAVASVSRRSAAECAAYYFPCVS